MKKYEELIEQEFLRHLEEEEYTLIRINQEIELNLCN